MSVATISVNPVRGGWTVEPEGAEPTLFLRGARAEAHARRLGQASWRTGVPAIVRVHDRSGDLVGTWRFGLEPEWIEDRPAGP